jgi:hypothetical protein
MGVTAGVVKEVVAINFVIENAEVVSFGMADLLGIPRNLKKAIFGYRIVQLHASRSQYRGIFLAANIFFFTPIWSGYRQMKVGMVEGTTVVHSGCL